MLRLTPPILDAPLPKRDGEAPQSQPRRPFWSRFDKTADMRSDQAFDLIAAASGLLALVALAYLAFLLVGGMF